MPPLRSSRKHYVVGLSVRPSVRPVLVITLSQELIDGFWPNLGHVCILQSQLIDWILGSQSHRSKVTGLIMYAKIACDHIIIRTDGQITMKLRTCMYLAEAMNRLDFGVMRSRSKVMGLIMYAKIACDRIIIRTDGWITIKLKTCMYLAEPMN